MKILNIEKKRLKKKKKETDETEAKVQRSARRREGGVWEGVCVWGGLFGGE